jgi:integrase
VRDDLDLEGRTVRIDEKLGEVRGEWVWGAPKTRASARVDLPDLLAKPLAEHLVRFPPLREQDDPRRDGLIFYGGRGGPVRRDAFATSWQRACAAAGLDGMRVEWLRHSGASLAYLATRDLKAVAARLGHTSTRMADTVYVEQYAEASRAVAGRDRRTRHSVNGSPTTGSVILSDWTRRSSVARANPAMPSPMLRTYATSRRPGSTSPYGVSGSPSAFGST